METPAPPRTSGRPSRARGVTVALAVSALTLAACTAEAEPDGAETTLPRLDVAQSPIMNGHNITRDHALLTMEVLPVSPTSRAGYSPDLFEIDQDLLASEAGWTDSSIPYENCVVPDAALARDSESIQADADTCEISDGVWFDPLSGQTVTRDDVEAKPFLPTERAWASGAGEWDGHQFSVYRNSPQSVMAISDESYDERGQQGPADWRPENKSLWCGYALRWVSEKSIFGLALESEAESDALIEMLNTCPDEGFANQAV